MRASVISPILEMLNNYTMKIVQSSQTSAFGGINFVLEEFKALGIDKIVNNKLPDLPSQSSYTWYDIIASYWSVFFCGGDCAEDLAINLRDGLKKNPFIKVPSPDRVLERTKSLASKASTFENVGKGKSKHTFYLNSDLNRLNLNILKRLPAFKAKDNVLDYDNTLIHCDKEDAMYTYLKKPGYSPGIAMIGNDIVYLEGRNGNSAPQTLQEDTFSRMFKLLKEEGITIKTVRADSASYALKTILEISKNVETFFIRARMNTTLEQAISKIEKWTEVKIDGRKMWRASTFFTPFENAARKHKVTDELKQYRLVVTKEKRNDGQINMFTGEPCNYSAIITSDYEKSNDEVVFFYNARGTSERVFDELKNDFGWNSLPFSKLGENTVFLLITAMCKNLYNHIIVSFSKKYLHLEKQFRIKKFRFRFINIPAKWVKSGRMIKLRLYGNIKLQT